MQHPNGLVDASIAPPRGPGDAPPDYVPKRRTGLIADDVRAGVELAAGTFNSQTAFVQLANGAAGKADYAALLGRLYGFHWPLELKLRTAAALAPPGVDLWRREKSDLLRADLRLQGLTKAEIDKLPHARPPEFGTALELMGCLYAVEAAGFTGKALARKLDYLLGDVPLVGRRFLSGRPAPDALPWALVCDVLEGWSAPRDVAAIVASANRTFEVMTRWLSAG